MNGLLLKVSTRCLFPVFVLSVLTRLALSDDVLINEVQVIGTHNSYHVAPHASIMKIIKEDGPNRGAGIEYTHRPLATQFSQLGIRQIELDVRADPTGGLYAEPIGLKLAAERGLSTGPVHDPDRLLLQPGLKVLHAPGFDFDHIQNMVKQGFLVRTRADVGTRESRANDPRRRDKAFASGAQFISTDYPEPNPRFSSYRVRFEGGIVVRTNPVNGDAALSGIDLEQQQR